MSNAFMLPVTCNSRTQGCNTSAFPDGLWSVLLLLQKWIYVQLSLSQIEVFILPFLLEWMLISKLSYIKQLPKIQKLPIHSEVKLKVILGISSGRNPYFKETCQLERPSTPPVLQNQKQVVTDMCKISPSLEKQENERR